MSVDVPSFQQQTDDCLVTSKRGDVTVDFIYICILKSCNLERMDALRCDISRNKLELLSCCIDRKLLFKSLETIYGCTKSRTSLSNMPIRRLYIVWPFSIQKFEHDRHHQSHPQRCKQNEHPSSPFSLQSSLSSSVIKQSSIKNCSSTEPMYYPFQFIDKYRDIQTQLCGVRQIDGKAEGEP